MSHTYNFKSFRERYGLNSELFDSVLNIIDPNTNGPWLAGGAIRRLIAKSKIDSDFDVFFKSEDQLLKWLERIKKQETSVEEIKNEFNTTLQIKVNSEIVKLQAIHFKYYSSPQEIIDSFDYTICQFAVDGNHLVTGDYSLFDLANKRLVLHKMTYGVATLRRLLKYCNQGFTACNGTLKCLLEAAVDNPDIIQEDIPYLD